MNRIRSLAPAALATLLVALPGVAQACAVCFSATDQNRNAFLGTTLFLTLLPLVMIGSASLFVWRRSQAIAEQEPAEAS